MPGVSLARPLTPDEVVCPAGVLSGDCDVRCNIEDSLIEGRLNPESVATFCTGDYAACSTWRASKEVERRGGDLKKILAAQQAERSRMRSRKMLRDARLRAARERLEADTPEARRYRQEVARIMDAAQRRNRHAGPVVLG